MAVREAPAYGLLMFPYFDLGYTFIPQPKFALSGMEFTTCQRNLWVKFMKEVGIRY